MIDAIDIIGKLFRVNGSTWSRVMMLNHGDLILIIGLENPTLIAASWRRELTFLHNGRVETMMFTRFKSMLRCKELEIVQQ